jgi:hypothetical protein
LGQRHDRRHPERRRQHDRTGCVDYDEIPFPGTVGTFVYAADNFVRPIGPASRDLAVDFLDTFVSDESTLRSTKPCSISWGHAKPAAGEPSLVTSALAANYALLQ